MHSYSALFGAFFFTLVLLLGIAIVTLVGKWKVYAKLGMRLLKRHVKRAICKGTATWKLVKYQIDPLEYAARLAAGKGKE